MVEPVNSHLQRDKNTNGSPKKEDKLVRYVLSKLRKIICQARSLYVVRKGGREKRAQEKILHLSHECYIIIIAFI
jgi:hypothetical protein